MRNQTPVFVEKFFDGYEDVYIDVQLDDNTHEDADEIYGWGKKV